MTTRAFFKGVSKLNLNSKMWLDIINQALIMISADPLQDIDDGKQAASIAISILPNIIEELYASLPLNDIAGYTELARVSKPAGSPYSYAYKLPDDCARIRTVNTDSESWEISRDHINTNASSCKILYIQTPSSPDSMPFYARNLAALLLASRIAIPITHDQNLSASLYNQYSTNLSKAITLAQSTQSQQRYKEAANYTRIFSGD